MTPTKTENPVGYLDADSEEKNGFLQDIFIKTENFNHLLIRDCYFMSGRKGDGKTAIALMLRNEMINDKKKYQYSIILSNYEIYKSVTLDINRIQYGLYQKKTVAYLRFDFGTYFEKVWMFFFYICALKSFHEKNKTIPEVNDFLKENGFITESIDPDPIARSFIDIILKDFETVGLTNTSGDVSNLQPSALKLIDQVSKKLEDQKLITAIRLLQKQLENDNDRLLIVFDTLEKYFSYADDYRPAVQGLTKSIIAFMRQKENSRIDIKCFLPDELFDKFSDWNPQKMYDLTESILWSYRDLLLMICTRLINYMKTEYPELYPVYKEKWDAIEKNDKDQLRSFWENFFPPTIRDTYGVDEDCFNYLLRHSQNKPRHIIHMVNKIILEAEKKGHVLPNKIPQNDIHNGIHHNFGILVNDIILPFVIQDEYEQEQIPSYILTMFTNQEQILDGKRIKNIILEYRSEYSKFGLTEVDIEFILLRSGLLGIVNRIGEINKPNGEKLTVFYATYDYLIEDHITKLNLADRCAIHSLLYDCYGNRMRFNGDKCAYPYNPNHEGAHDSFVTQLTEKTRYRYP